MRARPFGVALTAALASATLVANSPSSFLVGNSGPFKRIDTTLSHERSRQLLIHQRNRARAAAAPVAQSEDIGDVAVIVDNGAILVPPTAGHPFDLTAPAAIVFTPSTGGFNVAAIQVPFDPNVGAPLALGDDDTTGPAERAGVGDRSGRHVPPHVADVRQWPGHRRSRALRYGAEPGDLLNRIRKPPLT
jgi:hypothetical protein